MEYVDINKTISENLIKYRKQAKITQLELAQMLNYSDKAISKWERGESLPDISVLYQIANIFGITLNELCYQQPESVKISLPQNKTTKHLYIAALGTVLVWLIATIVFAMLLSFAPELSKKWIAFIIALPASGIVLLVFNTLWGKKILNIIFVSIIIWGTLLSICLSSNFANINWLYLIGIPLEALTVIWYIYKAQKTQKK